MRILKLKQHHSDFEELDLSLNIHQKIVFAFVLINFFLLAYDGLFQIIIGIFHALFESVEHLLDLCIEHLLDTGTHETQVIVFYILVAFIFFGLYRLYRFLPRWYDKLKKNLSRQKLNILSEWHRLPLLQRFEWWSFFVVYFACLVFFSF